MSTIFGMLCELGKLFLAMLALIAIVTLGPYPLWAMAYWIDYGMVSNIDHLIIIVMPTIWVLVVLYGLNKGKI